MSPAEIIPLDGDRPGRGRADREAAAGAAVGSAAARAAAERARRRSRPTPLVGRRPVERPMDVVPPVPPAAPPPDVVPPLTPAAPPAALSLPADPLPADPQATAPPADAPPSRAGAATSAPRFDLGSLLDTPGKLAAGAGLTDLAGLAGLAGTAGLTKPLTPAWSAVTGAPTAAAVDAARLIAGLLGQAEGVIEDILGAAGLPDRDEAIEELQRLLGRLVAVATQRAEGDYEVDEFGFDRQFTDTVLLPLLRPLYRRWFRVEVKGLEHLPADGPALLVANHSGAIALDSLMLSVAVHDEHPAHRHLRMLGADLVFRTPVLGEVSRRGGVTLASMDDALRLLRAGHLVGVWPEGFKGVGKPFSERYRLQRFGRGGFVAAALRTGTPIVPVAIVGAEEAYPIIGDMPALARLFGLPYAPVTPTWPLLGPLGMVPLPSKWTIQFCPPLDTAEYGEAAADDSLTVFDLTDTVRHTIQQALYDLLVQRGSVFL